MTELTVNDVESFTRGRLDAGDDETADVLAAALSAARRYCGWHVTPVIEDDEVTIDSAGGRVLTLPTMNLIAVKQLSEDGIDVSPADLRVSRIGAVAKRSGRLWQTGYAIVVAVIDHGFTEQQAADWRRGVLRLSDMMAGDARIGAIRDSPDLTAKSIDDVSYQWSAQLISMDVRLSALFAAYRILQSP